MNAHETTEIRELTATELDHVSGGVTVAGWLENFAKTFITRAIQQDQGQCTIYCD